ncbi:MAG: YitT family protein, partial [Bacilli bacterium]
ISICAGLLIGIGLGLIFKSGFSTGGTDIFNQIVSKYTKITMGRAILYSDSLIILISIFIFGINNIVYSITVLLILTLIIDIVMKKGRKE